jgi:hypothetical protein
MSKLNHFRQEEVLSMNVSSVGSAPVNTELVNSGSKASAADKSKESEATASATSDTVSISEEAKQLLKLEGDSGVVKPMNGGGTEPPKLP